jgi:hypothetical protein
MIEYYSKDLALAEAITLWKYLAETGEDNKLAAITTLYKEGKLSRPEYTHNCPLCDFDRRLQKSREYYAICSTCPWPGEATREYRCEKYRSPYSMWNSSYNSNYNNRIYAKQVYELLLTLKETT